MSIANSSSGQTPSTAPAFTVGALTQRARGLTRIWRERVKDLSTPALLRLLLGVTWGCAFLLWATAYLGVGVYRDGLQHIGRESGAGVLQAKRLKTSLAAMDASVLQILLVTSDSRDLSGALEAQDLYELHRREFGTVLVEAAVNMGGQPNERALISRLQNQASLYDSLVTRAIVRREENTRLNSNSNEARSATNATSTDATSTDALTASTSNETDNTRTTRARAEDASNYNVANKKLKNEVFALTNQLSGLKNEDLEQTYVAQSDAQNALLCGLVLCGLLLIAALVATQYALFQRTRRLVNPGLGLATLLSVALFLWLGVSFMLANSELRLAKENGFDTLSSLEDARESAYEARSQEGLYLLLPTNSQAQKEAKGAFEAAFQSASDALDTSPGAVRRSSSAYNANADLGATRNLFQTYNAAHTNLVTNEIQNRHQLALQSGTELRASSPIASQSGNVAQSLNARQPLNAAQSFTTFDSALSHNIDEYQQNFDTALEGGFRRLQNQELFVSLLMLVLALTVFLGITSRLKEYAV